VAEVYLIAENVRPWFRALVLMAGFTGLRWGELMALTRREVDLKAATVKVAAAVIELDKLSLGPPKSRAGQRTVALPRQLVDELQRHLDKHAERGPRGRVFVGPTGVTPRRTNFNREWHRATKAAGVEGLRFHDLRHTANTLAAPGSSTKELMRRMGHASTRAALMYQHASDDRDRVIADALGDAIDRARGEQGDDNDGGSGAVVPARPAPFWHGSGTRRPKRPERRRPRSRSGASQLGFRGWHPQRDSNPCRHLEGFARRVAADLADGGCSSAPGDEPDVTVRVPESPSRWARVGCGADLLIRSLARAVGGVRPKLSPRLEGRGRPPRYGGVRPRGYTMGTRPRLLTTCSQTVLLH